MKKIILLFAILSVSVVTSACINNLAVQELNNKAVDYMNKGDAETAVCRLKSSLDLDNDVYETHYNLAVAYNALGRYSEAVEELNKVTELNPEFADALYTLAVAKEALAYDIIKDAVESGNPLSLTRLQIEDYNNKAADVIETYNLYLVKNPGASDADKINEKITALNEKIKEYTGILESQNNSPYDSPSDGEI